MEYICKKGRHTEASEVFDAKGRQIEAREIFDSMVQKVSKPNATSTSENLLNAYATKGGLDNMHEFRTLMIANEITLNHQFMSSTYSYVHFRNMKWWMKLCLCLQK
jgi:hypothetical protein